MKSNQHHQIIALFSFNIHEELRHYDCKSLLKLFGELKQTFVICLSVSKNFLKLPVIE